MPEFTKLLHWANGLREAQGDNGQTSYQESVAQLPVFAGLDTLAATARIADRRLAILQAAVSRP